MYLQAMGDKAVSENIKIASLGKFVMKTRPWLNLAAAEEQKREAPIEG